MSNIWIAASDGNTQAVLNFISQNPSAVNSKDENGYTPIHACVSYGHTDLLRLLITQHGGNVNIPDDEGDTPLFTCETVEMAEVLVGELGADWTIQNEEGLTAADSIEEDGQYPLIVGYLRSLDETPTSIPTRLSHDPGSPPDGVGVDVRAIPADALPETLVDDGEFKRRIEELAAKGDFGSADAQRSLRELVADAVQQHVLDGGNGVQDEDDVEEERRRNVRSRQ